MSAREIFCDVAERAVADTIEAEQAALVALRHVRTGLASPDLLADLLDRMPMGQRRAFLRKVQKAIEQAGVAT